MTKEQIKKEALSEMLKALITEDSKLAESHLHDYLQIKTQEIILGEKDDEKEDDDEKDDDDDEKEKEDDDDKPKSKKKGDDDDEDDEDDDDDDDDDEPKGKKGKVTEQTRQAAFSNSGSVMDDKVKGKIKYENGGKKTLKKHGNAPKELDDDKVDKIKFKSGGRQPAKTLEKTPKPNKFNDGRDKELGTTKA